MAARYRKIDPRFWKDEKVRRLDAFEKLTALYLFTGQSNRIGLFNFSPGEAAEDLGMSPETFAKAFEKVCQTLGIRWDLEARVLYLPTWWKYNCPENPNVLKAALQDLHDVPQTLLLKEFSINLRYLPKTFHETFSQTLPKGCAEPSDPGAGTGEGEREGPPSPTVPTTKNADGKGFEIPPAVVAALDQAAQLGASPRLRQPDFWQAELTANPGIDAPAEILKAEAWLAANPEKPRKKLAAFLHNWLKRADRSEPAERKPSPPDCVCGHGWYYHTPPPKPYCFGPSCECQEFQSADSGMAVLAAPRTGAGTEQ